MNPTGCHDCDSLTCGACPQHSTWTIVTGPTYPAGTIVSPTVPLDTVVEIARLRAENAALRGQVAALREMPDGYGCDDCLAARHDDHDDTMCDGCSAAARKILDDTEAAAREHDGVVRAQAFEEAAQDARQVASVTDRVGDIQYRNGALIVAKALDDRAAALREKARKP